MMGNPGIMGAPERLMGGPSFINIYIDSKYLGS